MLGSGRINHGKRLLVIHRIPAKFVGLIIGNRGDTIKSINERSGAEIFISKSGTAEVLNDSDGSGSESRQLMKEIEIRGDSQETI